MSRDLILIRTASLESDIFLIKSCPAHCPDLSLLLSNPHTDRSATLARPKGSPLWPPSASAQLATHSCAASSTWRPLPAPHGWSTKSAESSGEKSQQAGEILARLTNPTFSRRLRDVFAQRGGRWSSPSTWAVWRHKMAASLLVDPFSPCVNLPACPVAC